MDIGLFVLSKKEGTLLGIKGSVGMGLGCISMSMMQLAMIGLHFFTVFLAFVTSGLISAVLTLCFPFISWVYWFYRFWKASGTIFNLYGIASLVVVGLFVLMMVGGGLMASDDK